MNAQLQAAPIEETLQVSLSGFDLINSPRLNKGTAFTDHERDIFDLHGLLPPHVGTLDEQVDRRMQALDQQSTPFNKYAFLQISLKRWQPSPTVGVYTRGSIFSTLRTTRA